MRNALEIECGHDAYRRNKDGGFCIKDIGTEELDGDTGRVSVLYVGISALRT